MTTLSFHRYVCKPESKEFIPQVALTRLDFLIQVDHIDTVADSITLEEIKKVIEKWLDDHVGYVKINIGSSTVHVSNADKFYMQMIEQKILPVFEEDRG